MKSKCRELKINPTRHLVCVSIGEQRQYFFKNNSLALTYRISTSRRPPSCINGSLGTPTGLHRIAEKIGAGAPTGSIFKGRVNTGLIFSDIPRNEPQENLITTRILWLDGLEAGHNQGGDRDTRNRYVYIHGTNREAALGTPQSAGCVLMSNEDVQTFFDEIDPGALVWISP